MGCFCLAVLMLVLYLPHQLGAIPAVTRFKMMYAHTASKASTARFPIDLKRPLKKAPVHFSALFTIREGISFKLFIEPSKNTANLPMNPRFQFSEFAYLHFGKTKLWRVRLWNYFQQFSDCYLSGEKSSGFKKRLFTPSLTVSEPPAPASEAFLAATQAGSSRKASNDAFATSADACARR